MSQKFNVSNEEISGHFVEGNVLESKVWQKLPAKTFDIIFARRFFSMFEKPEKAIETFLKQINDYCTPKATVVLDWMAQSGAERDGARPSSMMYAIRTVGIHSTNLHNVSLSSKIKVLDLEIWMTRAEMEEVERQMLQRLQSVDVEIVDASRGRSGLVETPIRWVGLGWVQPKLIWVENPGKPKLLGLFGLRL